MRPLLELKNYPHGFSSILKKFEAGQNLTSDQLHFIASHEKALSNSTLDPVLRYYLTEHKLRPHKALPLELPQEKLTEANFKQLKHNMHLLLRNNLTHVDLNLSPQQFLEFKAVGIHELVFWHGNHHLQGSVFHQGNFPYKLYFQWGRMFGVVKIHLQSCGKIIEGKVLIFLQDMHEKSLQECIATYTHQLQEKQSIENKLIHTPEPVQVVSQHKLPVPMPNYFGGRPEEKE